MSQCPTHCVWPLRVRLSSRVIAPVVSNSTAPTKVAGAPFTGSTWKTSPKRQYTVFGPLPMFGLNATGVSCR